MDTYSEKESAVISLGRKRSDCFHHMASTRRLLVLLLLPLLQMGESGFTSFQFASEWSLNTQTIPSDGIYIVSFRADPCAGCYMALSLYYVRSGGCYQILYKTWTTRQVTHVQAAVFLESKQQAECAEVWENCGPHLAVGGGWFVHHSVFHRCRNSGTCRTI